MTRFNSEHFRQEVINIVSQIPRGRVLTYGQIARLAGYPLHARHVGNALHELSDEAIPCHRVVNSAGRLAPNWPEQRQLLESAMGDNSLFRTITPDFILHISLFFVALQL